MDKKAIRKALDAFEDDRYSDAKGIIKKEIKAKRDEFVKTKLELKNDINPVSKDVGDDADDNKGDKGEE